MSSTQQLLLTEGVGAAPNYIEDVFSTYLWTGTGATLSIVNNIDLATKGGLTWIKQRGQASAHALFDTARGATNRLATNGTNAQATVSGVTAFNTNGFTSGTDAETNGSGNTYVGWTFRKQPKFFDVVTWTGDGTNGRNIPHNLGSVPGCIIVKCTSTSGDWGVYHRSIGATKNLKLNLTNAEQTSIAWWNNTAPTSTNFTLYSTPANVSGDTYVAYIFAHDAGGFGLTGTDNVISCGSFVNAGSDVSTTLGYEPQWLMVKNATVAGGNWTIWDNMRGMPVGSADARLYANLSNAETTSDQVEPTATGFTIKGAAFGTGTYIYIAIRRGPMKVPTDGTKVFAPVTYTGSGAAKTVTAGFPVDLSLNGNRNTATLGQYWFDRLRGAAISLNSAETTAETTDSTSLTSFASNTEITLGTSASGWVNDSGRTYIDWMFRRAPSFFDEVCYTGTGSATTFSHNLGVAPELMIVKNRTGGGSSYEWAVYAASQGATKFAYLNATSAFSTSSVMWNDTAPTSSVFTVGIAARVNGSGNSLVAYLFATCAGVSKVGSYTGNGSTQAIACGFTGGARFVLIKRTDSTGGWYVYDTARGMTLLTDPYLFLNSTAAESATLGSVTTTTGGFTVDASILAAINTNAASYIFLAIA